MEEKWKKIKKTFQKGLDKTAFAEYNVMVKQSRASALTVAPVVTTVDTFSDLLILCRSGSRAETNVFVRYFFAWRC